MEHMDERYGLPTGMYNGDENLPQPATRSPSRGIELCGVVEAMYSYNTMFATHGDVIFADRAERIAYNALPATWASPKGGDMWVSGLTNARELRRPRLQFRIVVYFVPIPQSSGAPVPAGHQPSERARQRRSSRLANGRPASGNVRTRAQLRMLYRQL